VQSFEKYHPLLTPHYKLDWPTTVSLNKLHLNPQVVNHQMISVMKGEKLVYAITERDSKKFMKIIEITMKDHTAYLSPSPIDPEIIEYLRGFLKQNFGTKKILAFS
jgi:hypothetical protein